MSAEAGRIPYPGPRPFEQEEEDLFFGRDREVQDLVSLIIAHRAVLLYAQSGAGKTSLLKAKLIPRILREGIDVLPIARVQGVDLGKLGIESVPNIFAFNVLLSWSGEEVDPSALAPTSLAEFLRNREHHRDKRGAPTLRVAIFDQFEELFKAYPEHWQKRRALIEQIADACKEDRLLRVMLVIREDHLADLDSHAELLPEELRTAYRLECLGKEAAELAVEGPLSGTDRSFEKAAAGDNGKPEKKGAAEVLVEKLLRVQSKSQSGTVSEVETEFVEPVQLQVVCRRLWQKLPSDVKIISTQHLQDFGDVDEALGAFYDEAITAAAQAERIRKGKLRDWFERQLITAAGTRGTVFQGPVMTGGIPNRVVKTLEDDQHIVRADLRHGSRWYELTHDRLIEPIRRSNANWRRRSRGIKALVGVFVLLAVSFVLLGKVVPYYQEREVQKQLDAANKVIEKQKSDQAKLQERIDEMKFELGKANDRTLRVQMQAQSDRLEEEARVEKLKQENETQRVRQAIQLEGALQRARVEATEQALAEGQIEQLRKEGGDDKRRETVLDSITMYLWRKPDIPRLTTILKDAADLIPPYYGLDTTALSLMPGVEPDTEWPLTVEYSSRGGLDEFRFLYHWRFLASKATEMWGIPFPMRVRLKVDKNLPVDEFHVVRSDSTERSRTEADKQREQKVSVSTTATDVVVKRPSGPPALVQFFNEHKIRPLEQLKYGGEYWTVPNWTQPVWKINGHYVFHPEGAVALAVFNRLIDYPELVLTRDAVSYLLDRLSNDRPQTVSEALAARGFDRLVEDLARIVANPNKYPLTRLEYLLDSLANYPHTSTEDAVDEAISDQGQPVQTVPARLSSDPPGKPAKQDGATRTTLGLRHVYQEGSAWLPKPEPQVRVYLGPDLLQRFTTPDGGLDPELQNRLDDLGSKFQKRFGFTRPGVRFRDGSRDLARNAFRIEVLNQTADDDEATPIEVDGVRASQRLIDELEFRYYVYRTWWLTPERVHLLILGLPKALRTWLEERYSLTDLKLILRSLIAPTSRELQAHERNDTRAALLSIPPGQTLDQLDWLLGSMVFWDAIHLRDGGPSRIADQLRSLQEARLAGVREILSPGETQDLLRMGVAALSADKIEPAVQAFADAVRLDRRGSISAFRAIYAEQASQKDILANLKLKCRLPEPGRLLKALAPLMDVRYDIDQYLEQSGPELQRADRRQLELCLLWSTVRGKLEQKTEAPRRWLTADYRRGSWSPQEEYLFAHLLLDEHGKVVTSPLNLGLIEQLLESAFTRLDRNQAEAGFKELLDRYPNFANFPAWHVRLLRGLPSKQPDSYWIPYLLGVSMAGGKSREDVSDAMALLKRAEDKLSVLSSEEKPKEQAWLALARSLALLTVMNYGEPTERDGAYEEITKLIRNLLVRVPGTERGWPPLDSVYSVLVSANLEAGKLEKAASAADEWIRHVPGSTSAVQEKVFIHLARGETQAAVNWSRKALGEGKNNKDEKDKSLFLAALTETLTGSEGYEEHARTFINDTGHEYRDYIRLLLYWRLKLAQKDKDADELITERWKSIDPTTWVGRLDQGDATVWREKLIGYYANSIRQDDILGVVQSRENFQASPLSRVGLAYGNVAAEAFFYDALYQEVSGDRATRLERRNRSLERAVATGYLSCYENHMARYLLGSRR